MVFSLGAFKKQYLFYNVEHDSFIKMEMHQVKQIL